MAVAWEWVASPGLTKDIVRSDALPEDEEDYEPAEYYDIKAPTREVRFAAEGMTLDQFTELQDYLAERGRIVSVTDNTGKAWVGKFRSLTGNVIKGSEYVDGIQLTIEA